MKIDFSCTVSNASPRWTTWKALKWQALEQVGRGNSYLFGFKDAWVEHNRETIKSCSKKYQFPSFLLAGVAWNEVGGDPEIVDTVSHAVRSFDWSGPDIIDEHFTITKRPELTSFGPIQMQIRRAAETIGVPLEDLSFHDRHRLGRCLEVDVYNIDITARHLRDLIGLDGLQTTPPHLSDDGVVIAATRYNRGPHLSLLEIRQNTRYGDVILGRKDKLVKLLG